MMWLLLSAFWLIAGCSVIDDDLSDCHDEAQFQMTYQLKLITNMTTELQTQLTTITEMRVAGALQTHLAGIFTDKAKDVDLSFYETEGMMNRLEHTVDIINANQTTYTLTLPMRKYLHLAVANIADNHMVNLENDKQSFSSMLLEENAAASNNILPSHTTGLFTARQPMEVLEGVDQTFNVKLYMANSATTLVLDPKGISYTDIKVYATGFATSFLISDSTYVYPETSPLIKADQVETGNNLLCFTTVNFPSKNGTRAEAIEPTLWQFKVYITKTDGTVTETVLDIKEPLKAGDLKIIKGDLDDDAAVRPYNSRVGVSVTLDWNSGGEYEWEM